MYPRHRSPRRRPRGPSIPHLLNFPVSNAAAPRDQVLLVPVSLHRRLPVPRLPEGGRRALAVAKGLIKS